MQAIKSVSTSLLGISGDCILALTPQQQLVCALSSTRQLMGVWPFGSLRTYWGGKERFGFKSGRRSPRGEGEFAFVTKQGEEIYSRLQRAINLTSLVSKSEVEDSLPPDPTRAETPVPFSDSDEELPHFSEKPPPPVPDKPPELLKRLSMGGLPPTPSPTRQPLVPGSVATDEISETGPAYFTSQNPKYLHQQAAPMDSPRVKPAPRPVVKPPLESTLSAPICRRPLPLEDDTYSHATHDIPQSFVSRHSSLKTTATTSADTDKDKIYHGLVRNEATVSPSRTPLNPAEPIPESDITYDIAYPVESAAQQAKVPLPIPDGEYSSMGETDQQKKALMERKMSVEGRKRLLSEETLSFGAKLRGGVEGVQGRKGQGSFVEPQEDGTRDRSDTMTANPLYGSHDNLLVDFVNFENSSIMSSARYNNQGGYHEDMVNDPLTDSMVANPVYGEHMPSGAAGYSRNVGMFTDDRPVSPLENNLVSNPLYGQHRNRNPLHQGVSDIDGATLQSSDPNSERTKSGGHTSSSAGGSKQTPEGEGTSPEEQTDSTGDDNVSKGTDAQQDGEHNNPSHSSSSKEVEDVNSMSEQEESSETKGSSDSQLSDSDTAALNHESSVPSITVKPDHLEKRTSAVSTTSNSSNHESSVPSITVKPDYPEKRASAVSTTSNSSNGCTPVHNSHDVSGKASPSRLGQGDATLRTSPVPAKGGTPVHVSHALVKGHSPVPTSSASASPIHRDGRGYSKVDKTRKAEVEEESDISPPPPIPPRKYSNGDS